MVVDFLNVRKHVCSTSFIVCVFFLMYDTDQQKKNLKKIALGGWFFFATKMIKK